MKKIDYEKAINEAKKQRRTDRRNNRLLAGYKPTVGNLPQILQASTPANADRIKGRIKNTLKCKNDREIGRFLVCPARIELTIVH